MLCNFVYKTMRTFIFFKKACYNIFNIVSVA